MEYLLLCYKNTNNPWCIDLIITNNLLSFQTSCVIEISLFDFPKTAVIVMKTSFEKLKTKVIQFRDYKQFCNDKFRQNLLSDSSLQNLRSGCNRLEKSFVLSTRLLQEKRNTDVETICLL